jgi:outer membrane protein assembly factor BamB
MMRGKRGTRGLCGAGVAMFTLTAVAMLAVAPSASAAATSGGTAWRFDGYSVANNGFNPDETVITATTVAGLHHAWSVAAPVRTGCATQGHPVVADGRLFLSDPGGIAAYDAATGAPLWRRDFGDGADTNTVVAVVDNRLFVAASDCFSESDPDGVLRVLSVASGALHWQVRRDEPMYALVVDRDTVIVSGADAGSSDTTAYRVTNGKVRWDRPGTRMDHSASAAGRVLIKNANVAGSVAVDTVTGVQLWSTTTSYDALAAGVTGGRFVARGPDNALVALNSATGAVQWSVPNAAGEVAMDAERVYVAGPGFTFTARGIFTGAVKWSRTFDARLGKPVVAGGVAYATVDKVSVTPLRASDGAPLTGSGLCPGVVWHPVIVNAMLYTTDGAQLSAFTV